MSNIRTSRIRRLQVPCWTTGARNQAGSLRFPYGDRPGTAVSAGNPSGRRSTRVRLGAAAPAVNEDWRIAAECAASSGGEPITSAACAGGRLAIRELLGCLKGKFGESGCFGEGNTIRKFVTNAWGDLTKGPGKNNEVVKAVHNLGREASAAYDKTEKVVQNAGKELERGAHAVGRSLEKAGNWLKKRFGL